MYGIPLVSGASGRCSSRFSPSSCKRPANGPKTGTFVGTGYLDRNVPGSVATTSKSWFGPSVTLVGKLKPSPDSLHVLVGIDGKNSGTLVDAMFFNSTNSSAPETG